MEMKLEREFINMNDSFSFKVNDDVIDSLLYFVESIKKENKSYCEAKFPNGKIKKFEIKKMRFNLKTLKKKKGKKYKIFIKPSNEYFFEGSMVNE